MNSVKSVYDSYKSVSDIVKKNVLLYGESRFLEFKNKFILQAAITYITGDSHFV